MRCRRLPLSLCLAVLLGCGGDGDPKTTSRPTAADTQGQRKDIIDGLIQGNVFEKLERAEKPPRLFVKADFLKMTSGNKERLLSIVHAYCFEGAAAAGQSVELFDSQSGKKIGVYSEAGLKLD